MIEIIKTLVLGIIQGITEWLPISSTGHMILFNDFFPLQVYADPEMNKKFVDMFLVVIQFGSILAVGILYFKKLNPFVTNKNKRKKVIDLWLKVAVAAVPAAIVGLLFDDIIDSYLYNSLTVAIALIVYGIAFIVIESNKPRERVISTSAITFKTAALIGCFQMLALIPGTSRSGATILGAIILGLSRATASEFSFFLAIPMMFGASLLKIVKMKMALDMWGISILMIGLVTAFLVSVVAIKTFMSFIKKHDFKFFGVYRIVLGIIIVLVHFLVK